MTTRNDTQPRADRSRIGVDVRCLTDEAPRGFARYTLELIGALTRRSEIELIGFSDAPVSVELPVPVRRFGGDRELVREQVALARVVAQEHLDVLLVPTNRGLPWAAPCATVLTLHDVVEWDPGLVTPPRGKSRFRFGYASVLSLAGADLVITVSHASASRIRQRLHVPDHRLRVVHEAASARFTRDGSSPDDDIDDPIGRPRRVYESLADELDRLTGRMVELAWPAPFYGELIPAR